jgi:hypothetical protein
MHIALQSQGVAKPEVTQARPAMPHTDQRTTQLARQQHSPAWQGIALHCIALHCTTIRTTQSDRPTTQQLVPNAAAGPVATKYTHPKGQSNSTPSMQYVLEVNGAEQMRWCHIVINEAFPHCNYPSFHSPAHRLLPNSSMPLPSPGTLCLVPAHPTPLPTRLSLSDPLSPYRSSP